MCLDTWVGLVVLAGLFLLQGALPYYQGRDRRYVHRARNLDLAVASSVVGAALASLLFWAFSLGSEQGWGLCPRLDLGGLGCGLISFLLFDLWMYAWHRANHQIPFLWRFHRVHHTNPAMDCTTALRFHPGEILLSGLANLPVIVALGMSLQTLVFYEAVMVAVILFHYSNVAVSARIDWGLRRIIVPPSMQRVHHSEIRAETDSKCGTSFSFWDQLFGSLRLREDTQAIGAAAAGARVRTCIGKPTMNARPRLLFVYNADTGLFNTLADATHKILSPQTYQCALCKVTYG